MKETKMSNTIKQQCKCCEIEDDCIDGLCSCCADYTYNLRAEIRKLKDALWDYMQFNNNSKHVRKYNLEDLQKML